MRSAPNSSRASKSTSRNRMSDVRVTHPMTTIGVCKIVYRYDSLALSCVPNPTVPPIILPACPARCAAAPGQFHNHREVQTVVCVPRCMVGCAASHPACQKKMNSRPAGCDAAHPVLR
jgi:hypothetical protein